MRMRPIVTSTAPQAIGPYSQAIEEGGLLFCSGQIPVNPETGQLVEGGITEQTERTLQNLSNLLTAGGSSLLHVIKTTVFLADLSHFQEMNEVYAKFFENHRPARSTVQVAALPMGALVEIDAVARVIE